MFGAEPLTILVMTSLPTYGIAALVVFGIVLAGWLGTGRLLTLANRTTESDAPDFSALDTPGFRLAVAATTVVAAVSVLGWTPMSSWPCWLGLIGLGPLLGWIDAATTWLPARLTHLLWLLSGVAVVVGTTVALWIPAQRDWWWVPVGSVAGAVGMGGFFAVVWWIGRGALGFGDVRLAVAIGATTGTLSGSTVVVAILVGTGSAALWAVLRAARRAMAPFPYGPFLLVGAFLAPMLTS